MYYAHSVAIQPKDKWQSLQEHLNEVAAMAGQFAAPFGAERAAVLAGLLHDLGKYTGGFQCRLEGGKSVDHATAGAKEVYALAKNAGPYDKIAAELIAYVIAGHHAGLPNHIGDDASLMERLNRAIDPPDPVWRSQISPDASNLWPALDFNRQDGKKAAFQLSFLGRMIFSCLIDADRRDTETFCAKAEGWVPDRNWPPLTEILGKLLGAFNAHMSDMQARAKETPVNALRREILSNVRARAAEKPGLFTLTVPTGGGKTLASLAFALDHAKAHGLTRIIYAIPFTSVVDQTATIFKDVLGEEVVLEHHSAIEDEHVRKPTGRGRDKLKLAMEDWAAPIVVTTNVQLFESLFAARTSRCRKLHNIARSVIVLDEAQTIPLPFLRPCTAALDELARNYGVSIVLCTATQPALDERHFKFGGLKLEGRELAPDPPRLSRALKRVQIKFGGEMSDEALVEALSKQDQGLIIVNSRNHALALYRKVKEAGLAGAIHLTTRQYAAHRRIILTDVRERLKSENGQPCRLIATSLVEAGVDLNFPRVWRAEAGLDQIAQAAGRCNREGRHAAEASIVTVFEAPENKPPREIEQFSAAFARMKDQHADLLSPQAIEHYFREAYWQRGAEGLDREKILDDFKMNGRETAFAYRCVGEKFRLIESGMVPVIVARDEKAKLALDRLGLGGVSPGGVARDLQTYVVQVPPTARALLWKNGHLIFQNEADFGDQFAVLTDGHLYHDEVGMLWEDADYISLENAII